MSSAVDVAVSRAYTGGDSGVFRRLWGPLGHPMVGKSAHRIGGPMWHKRDWQEFSKRARNPLERRLPPRPVAVSGANRVVPVVGFSLSELDDAGINLEAAEMLGLPI